MTQAELDKLRARYELDREGMPSGPREIMGDVLDILQFAVGRGWDDARIYRAVATMAESVEHGAAQVVSRVMDDSKLQ